MRYSVIQDTALNVWHQDLLLTLWEALLGREKAHWIPVLDSKMLFVGARGRNLPNWRRNRAFLKGWPCWGSPAGWYWFDPVICNQGYRVCMSRSLSSNRSSDRHHHALDGSHTAAHGKQASTYKFPCALLWLKSVIWRGLPLEVVWLTCAVAQYKWTQEGISLSFI